jgi:hypothetical protein
MPLGIAHNWFIFVLVLTFYVWLKFHVLQIAQRNFSFARCSLCLVVKYQLVIKGMLRDIFLLKTEDKEKHFCLTCTCCYPFWLFTQRNIMSNLTISIKVVTVYHPVNPLKTRCGHNSGQSIDREGHMLHALLFILLAKSHIPCYVASTWVCCYHTLNTCSFKCFV